MSSKNPKYLLLSNRRAGFEAVHNQETSGNLSLRGLRLPALFAIDVRRVADALVKETAERSQTLKADFETDVRDAQVISSQKLFRFFDAPLDQILVRSFVESLAEQPQEMITRETRVTGH